MPVKHGPVSWSLSGTRIVHVPKGSCGDTEIAFSLSDNMLLSKEGEY